MAITNKVTIDSKEYKVLAPGYQRASKSPKTVRRGVLGNTIVSTGAGSADQIVKSVLLVPYTPVGSQGSVLDLEAAMQKPFVSYTDHITGDATKWGSGTYNITIMGMEIMHMGEAPRPEPGYLVSLEWMKVLS